MAITFSEPVTRDQAEQVVNYHFEPALNVKSAKLSDDGTQCTLTLAEKATAPQGYQLSVTGVCDLSPSANRVNSNPVAVTMTRPILAIDYVDCSQGPIERRVSSLPHHAEDQWTMNLFVRTSKQPDDLTVIAGFGAAKDSGPNGTGRYLSKFTTGIHFWSRHTDVDSSTALDLDRWQMLTATYDGENLRMYKDAKLIGERHIKLENDEPVIHIAPADPWGNHHRFGGEISKFTVWKEPLALNQIRALQLSRPD
jgi:alpha-mannosidase